MIRPHRLAVAAVAAGLLGMTAVEGLASSLPQRTFPVSATPAAAGPSAEAAVSADGTTVAFDSAGSVYAGSVLRGTSLLISAGAADAAANGPSTMPSVSADGTVVAFASQATNLSPTGHAGDVYARAGTGPLEDLSVAADGGPANGPSSRPAVSADGRLVVFTSSASNLVAGDHNGVSDVFLRDRRSNTTKRISVGHGAVEGNGPSSTGAISADGRVISFASTATNLVPGDANGVADVFIRIPAADTTELASVSSAGQAQNAAVAAQFTQISSLSRDGRLVAFDSNATNLVPGEDPRARTNVFVRDRSRHTTRLVSQDNAGFEGNNDSFAPFITPSGLYVAFASFAHNLAPGGGPRQNVLVRDLGLGTTSVLDAAPDGSPPGPDSGTPPLQRPTISGDGTIGSFISTAANVTGSAGAPPAAFVRLLTAPRGFLVGGAPRPSRHPVVTVGADDPAATSFECRIDHRLPFSCAPGHLRLPVLPLGRHQLLVRAGGPGMLYDPLGIQVTLHVTARG